MKSLNEKILECEILGREFILTNEADQWIAGAGNPTSVVRLGEVSPIYEAQGKTPEQAVDILLKFLRKSLRIRS